MAYVNRRGSHRCKHSGRSLTGNWTNHSCHWSCIGLPGSSSFANCRYSGRRYFVDFYLQESAQDIKKLPVFECFKTRIFRTQILANTYNRRTCKARITAQELSKPEMLSAPCVRGWMDWCKMRLCHVSCSSIKRGSRYRSL